MNSVINQHFFKWHDLFEKHLAFLIGAKSEHLFHNTPIVPTAVKKHDFSGRGQVVDVALEIPLRRFLVGRFGKGDKPRAAWVKVFAETLDNATFSGCITTFKHQGDAGAAGFCPDLKFGQFDLQLFELFFIGFLAHFLVVRVTG